MPMVVSRLLDHLPGNWELFRSRPPVLSLCMIFGLTLSGDRQLYFHYGPLGNLAGWRYQQPVTLGTDLLTLSVAPSLHWLQVQRSRLPEITLVFGILLAYLLHMVLYIYRRLAHQHRLANRANVFLREEMKERERLQQEIEWIARHDELTQLPNRRELLRWMDDHRDPLPLALLICDLDHFKSVNDHFGHLEGDRYLKTITQRCRLPLERADCSPVTEERSSWPACRTAIAGPPERSPRRCAGR